MRNTLKFSLLGTLLCTMLFSCTGYSANAGFIDENGQFTFVKKKSPKTLKESDEEFVNRISEILKYNTIDNSYVTKNGITYYGQHGEHGKITDEEMERYNRLMEEKSSEDEANTSAESDEEFVNRISEILKYNTINNSYVIKNGITYYGQHGKHGRITDEEMERYNRIMKERNQNPNKIDSDEEEKEKLELSDIIENSSTEEEYLQMDKYEKLKEKEEKDRKKFEEYLRKERFEKEDYFHFLGLK